MTYSTSVSVLKCAVVAALVSGSVAFEWTNEKITQCARSARAGNESWLTANNASYICTDAQWNRYYDPATGIAPFLLNDDAIAPALAGCPEPGHVIKCFIFASWGQVAGGPDACGDSCSTGMGEGEQSCCGKACTSSGFSSVQSQTASKCTKNQWMTSKSAKCGDASGKGYCDCCPNCYDCVHPTPPLETDSKSYVASRFCDCRKGLEVSSDYAPCWNSCLDCFGDDGQVKYMPEDVASSCVGQSSCHIFVNASTKGNYWQTCTSSQASSCKSSATAAGIVPSMSKAKGMVLCGEAELVV